MLGPSLRMRKIRVPPWGQLTLGAMHTEKMLWGVSGDWLDGSEWITSLTFSGISTSGIAQSFISTVNSEIFARILFSRIALKDIFAS